MLMSDRMTLMPEGQFGVLELNFGGKSVYVGKHCIAAGGINKTLAAKVSG